MKFKYFVIKSPFAQMILLGYKDFEFRTNSKLFSNKKLCVSVSRSKMSEKTFNEQIKIWGLNLEEIENLRNLCKKTENGGVIIGEIEFGDEAFCYDPIEGNGIKINQFSLWDDSKWIHSPGGLGIRTVTIT